MVTSLRSWLILSFSALLFICLTAIYLFVSAINKSKKIETYHVHLKNTRILLLEINKLKENILIGDHDETRFYTSKMSELEHRFLDLKARTQHHLHHLESSKITEDYLLQPKIGQLKKAFGAYDKAYNELIYLYKLKGFKNFGLEGKMRHHAHLVFDSGNKEVQFYCLMLRRHEKDFLLRKELSYVHLFNNGIRALITFIHESRNIPARDKNYLINQLYYYNKYFRLLAQIESKIGIRGRNGYLNKSSEVFETIASLIEDMDNELKQIDTAHKKSLKHDTLVVVIILISFLAGTLIILTQLITRSVRSISSSFTNYVNSGFNFDSVEYKRTKIKEFNAIFVSFLKMAKEIHLFTNFFREKVHERTLAIHEQKEEILRQQKQIKAQYDTLLSRNTELKEQKHLLALKNNDIQGSLRYAKRIQKALQPGMSKFKESFPDSFVISKAKDVVSGDFHLAYKVQATGGDKTVLIAADCTGHGVPGAIMSVMGINILHKIVKELKHTDPGTILELLDKDMGQVLGQGRKKDDVIADGMDIGVFTFDRQSLRLDYSIAKFSGFLIREASPLPLALQKTSIGPPVTEQQVKHFTTSSVQLQPGDCLYLLSDGLQDQFGGPDNKKYKRTRILQLLEQLHTTPMAEQKFLFRQELKTWKKKLPQTDDILIIGIRF